VTLLTPAQLKGVVSSYAPARVAAALPASTSLPVHFRIATVLVQGGLASDLIANKSRSWLDAVPADRWLTEVNANGPRLRLALSLSQAGLPVTLGLGLKDAVYEHAKGLLSKRHTPESGSQAATSLMAVLDPDLAQNLRHDLLDLACGVRYKAEDLTVLLKVYGAAMTDDSTLARDAEKIVRLLLPTILRRERLFELTWAADLVEASSERLTRVGRPAMKEFLLRLDGARSRFVSSRKPKLLAQVERLQAALR
jgi:hypothetical protein